MKTMGKLVSILVLVAVLLSGCDMPYGGPTQHTFLQDRENVSKVEICTSEDLKILYKGSKPGPLDPIVTLSEEEIDSLWEELSAFPAYELNFVSHGWGDLVFVVSYANGEQELIGYHEIGIINEDGTFGGYRGHVLDDATSLSQLFAQYASAEILSKVSMSFRAYYATESVSP